MNDFLQLILGTRELTDEEYHKMEQENSEASRKEIERRVELLQKRNLIRGDPSDLAPAETCITGL